MGREDDEPAGGLHRVAVFDQRGKFAGLHAHVGQPGAFKLQFIGFASGQRHGAFFGKDHALVAHLGGQQRNVAIHSGLELAFIQDGAGAALLHDAQLARQKVSVRQFAGRRHQRPHIHLRAAPKEHTGAVEQKHLPIGRELAKDGTGVAAQHPVQRHGAGIGLDKVDLRRRADVEGLPVDNRLLAGLGHVHAVGGLRNAGATCGHLSARGQGVGCGHRWRGRCGHGITRSTQGTHQPQHQAGSPQTRAGAGRFALAFSALMGGNKRATHGAPDEVVGFVHGEAPARFVLTLLIR